MAVVDRAGMPFPRYFNDILLATPLIRATAARRVPAYLANLFEPPPRLKRKAPDLAATKSSAVISKGAEIEAKSAREGRAAQ